jgi:hypothetical protein
MKNEIINDKFVDKENMPIIAQEKKINLPSSS